MPRLASLWISFVVLAACKSANPASCELAANEGKPGCPDAPPVDMMMVMTCTDDTGCASTPDTPACDTSVTPTKCVLCTATSHAMCTGTTPTCSATHTCEACRVAADCPLSGVCFPTGACAAEADIAYVDDDGTNNATCTKATPCTKIESALATLRPYVKLHGAIEDHALISRNVTLLADPGAILTSDTAGVPIVEVSGASVVEIQDLIITESSADFDPGILTSGTSELTLKRVTISKNKGNGITCAGKSLAILNSTITANKLAGVSCVGGSVTASASTFSKNEGGGIALSGASFDLTNNFIYLNGKPGSGTSGSIVGGVSIPLAVGTANHFEFNTVVDNHARDSVLVPAAGVVCDLAGFMAPNNIIARNDEDGDVNKPNVNVAGKCMFPTSTIDKAVTALSFVSPDADPRDYHLNSDSTAIGMATTASTVTTDFDGNTRPQQGTSDQGADEFKPAP